MYWKRVGYNLRIEVQLPNFRRGSFKSSNSIIGFDIENSNKAINWSWGSNLSRRMSGHRNNTETMTRISTNEWEILRVPQLNRFVKRTGEEQSRAVVGGWDPRSSPQWVVVRAVLGSEPRQFHCSSAELCCVGVNCVFKFKP